jgi:hypothetical protein
MEVEPLIDGPAFDGPPVARPPVAGPQRVALARLAIGVLLLLITIVLFAGSRLVASSQQHSYDPGATPPASYRLIAGRTYQLSSPTGVAALQKAGRLTRLECYWSTDGQLLNPLTIVETLTDERDLQTFGTFTAPGTGPFQITCNGIDKVFVDDASNSGADTSALLMLMTIALGVLGVAATVSGAYELSELQAA